MKKFSISEARDVLKQMEDMQKQMEMKQNQMNETVKQFMGEKLRLCIGGVIFETMAFTLSLSPFFEALLGNTEMKVVQEDGSIFVDRDPKHFNLIMQFLRDSSTIFEEIRCKTVKELKEILAETNFYGLEKLQKIIMFELNNRFDPESCAFTMELSPLCSIVTRKNQYQNQHHSVVAGYSCTSDEEPRYIEFRINCCSDSKYIVIGITNKVPVSLETSSFPGNVLFPGFSYFGSNGNLYQKGASAAFGAIFGFGDRVGILIDMKKKEVQFYKNREIVGNAIKFEFEDAYVVVNMHTAGDQVQIISDQRFFDTKLRKTLIRY